MVWSHDGTRANADCAVAVRAIQNRKGELRFIKGTVMSMFHRNEMRGVEGGVRRVPFCV